MIMKHEIYSTKELSDEENMDDPPATNEELDYLLDGLRALQKEQKAENSMVINTNIKIEAPKSVSSDNVKTLINVDSRLKIRCDICGDGGSTNFDALVRHYSLTHFKDTIEKEFVDSGSLLSGESFVKLPIQQENLCDLCKKEFEYKDELIMHIGLEHNIVQLGVAVPKGSNQCPLCKKEFINETFYKQHLISYHYKKHIENGFLDAKSELECTLCEKKFNKKTEILFHIGIDHNIVESVMNVSQKDGTKANSNGQIKCNYCSFHSEFSHMKDHYLEDHFYGKLEEKCKEENLLNEDNKCQYCNLTVGSSQDLVKHLGLNHNKILFFMMSVSLSTKVKSPFSKPYIFAHFKTPENHSDSFPEHATVREANNFNMEKESPRKNKVDPEPNAEAHSDKDTIDTLENPVKILCNLCTDKIATNFDTLLRHYSLIHYQDSITKKYVPTWNGSCNLCKKIFDSKSDLIKHIGLEHNALKIEVSSSKCENTCPICKKEFVNLTFYQQHLIGSHFGHQIEDEFMKSERQLKCHLCEQEFQSKEKILFHIGISHGKLTKYLVPYTQDSYTKTSMKIKCEYCAFCSYFPAMKTHYIEHFFSKVARICKDENLLNSKNKCQFCIKSTGSIMELVTHLGINHNKILQFITSISGSNGSPFNQTPNIVVKFNEENIVEEVEETLLFTEISQVKKETVIDAIPNNVAPIIEETKFDALDEPDPLDVDEPNKLQTREGKASLKIKNYIIGMANQEMQEMQIKKGKLKSESKISPLLPKFNLNRQFLKKQNKLASPFSCIICKADFPSNDGLKKHIIFLHFPNLLNYRLKEQQLEINPRFPKVTAAVICPNAICKKVFRDEDFLLNHFATEHTNTGKKINYDPKEIIKTGEQIETKINSTGKAKSLNVTPSPQNITASLQNETQYLQNPTPSSQNVTQTSQNATEIPQKNATQTQLNTSQISQTETQSPKKATPSLQNALNALNALKAVNVTPYPQNETQFLQNSNQIPQNSIQSLKKASLSLQNVIQSSQKNTQSPQNLTQSLQNSFQYPETPSPSPQKAIPHPQNASPYLQNATTSQLNATIYPKRETLDQLIATSYPQIATPYLPNLTISQPNGNVGCQNVIPQQITSFMNQDLLTCEACELVTTQEDIFNNHRKALAHKFKVIRKYSSKQVLQNKGHPALRTCLMCDKKFPEQAVFNHLETEHMLQYMSKMRKNLLPVKEEIKTISTNPYFTVKEEIKTEFSSTFGKVKKVINTKSKNPYWFLEFKKFCLETKYLEGVEDCLQKDFALCDVSVLTIFLQKILTNSENIAKIDDILKDIGDNVAYFKENQNDSLIDGQNVENLEIAKRYFLIKEYETKFGNLGSNQKEYDPMYVIIFMSQLVGRPNVSKTDIEWIVDTLSDLEFKSDVHAKPLKSDQKILDFLKSMQVLLPDPHNSETLKGENDKPSETLNKVGTEEETLIDQASPLVVEKSANHNIELADNSNNTNTRSSRKKSIKREQVIHENSKEDPQNESEPLIKRRTRGSIDRDHMLFSNMTNKSNDRKNDNNLRLIDKKEETELIKVSSFPKVILNKIPLPEDLETLEISTETKSKKRLRDNKDEISIIEETIQTETKSKKKERLIGDEVLEIQTTTNSKTGQLGIKDEITKIKEIFEISEEIKEMQEILEIPNEITKKGQLGIKDEITKIKEIFEIPAETKSKKRERGIEAEVITIEEILEIPIVPKPKKIKEEITFTNEITSVQKQSKKIKKHSVKQEPKVDKIFDENDGDKIPVFFNGDRYIDIIW